ncbi:1-deoxy-D-xylulose-5-phosphate reductoisomerase [Henriciella mobilis]|uniref:1-deoxy-D-xylulose-5-phosphate reductoisomerase n=1 Tax=Henriciella mobilis TaxID=2305467 RepID=UPI000E662E42|nr:1-deoxy-D-xylulose-5-phosphate reductoisomerase [Henriciella mobilis]RIJ15453.1 1-deoxy-D-xylulose-5-phosphate reductoisomerase [Henriciella mobilis]RIJ18917.1 1-deoxy-D-xylulose-5-phosphate reductoisomerase [Henriciella mobilis]
MTMRVSIMGSTGSVGRSALSVMAHAGSVSEDPVFSIDTLTANSDVDTLARQSITYNARLAVVADDRAYKELKSQLAGTGIEVAAGADAIAEAAARPVDRLLAAIVGIAGLRSTYSALKAGNSVALANKESMVCAGPLLKRVAQKTGAHIIPTDSEHNAMFQVLERQEDVEKLVLTASGGPFLKTPLANLRNVTPEQACAHPRWSMGRKISVDSATFMNKALELIEAAYLFEMPQQRIDVLVHPQSIIHSLVAYRDGSVLAQLGSPDMKTPIAHALSWPERRLPTDVERLNLVDLAQLDFLAVDDARFPAIRLARQALDEGGGAPTVMNAANECAVEAFLNGRCRFTDISDVVEAALGDRSLSGVSAGDAASLDDIIALDAEVRQRSGRLIAEASLRTGSEVE